jgi:threonine synthase
LPDSKPYPGNQISLRCIRCSASYPADHEYVGCPSCNAEGVAVNLEVDYGQPPPIDLREWERRPRGLWRYDSALPLGSSAAVSLGEGATPLVACETLGTRVGLPRLLAKNESQNPTWSFKDRLGTLAISWARSLGRPGIALSSSGNAGATAAAYAARAGMRCIVFTTRSFPGPMLRFMRSFGAMVVAAPSAPERWTLNRIVCEQWGFMPVSNLSNPPIGSHPVAIEGCKTIAYEIVEDLSGSPPDVVVIPVAYGDALAGIYRGFQDLVQAGVIERIPRLVAAEAYPSLSTALRENLSIPPAVAGSGSLASSAATPQGTFQALRSIRGSGGTAVTVSNEEVSRARTELREREGLLVEFSSAMPFAAAQKLAAAGELSPDDVVVALITSSGLKDPESMSDDGELPLAEPTLESLMRVLDEEYQFAP